MHVDACIGGWVLPYLRRLGADVPDFGFGVGGITSISVDLHKYAYCPKGMSVLLHADAGLRRGQYFASADWPGYTMLNTTLQSTRSGGPLAAAWAVLRHVGDEGYARLAEQTTIAVRGIRAGIGEVPGLRILGDPVATLLAVTAETDAGFDLFTVADEMRVRGWYVQPQFAHASSPVNLHLTITAANRGGEKEFLHDLRSAVAAAREAGPATVDNDLLALLAQLDPEQLTAEQFAGLLAGADGGDQRPARRSACRAV